MFNYFPNNYTWSSAFYLALMAGGQFGEMERCLASLKDSEPNAQAWDSAWGAMAQQQERKHELITNTSGTGSVIFSFQASL